MSVFTKIAIVLLLLWVFSYTVSYGAWTWKTKNPLGGIAVFLLAVVTVVITVYVTFIRFG